MNAFSTCSTTPRHNGAIETNSAPGQAVPSQPKPARSLRILCIDDDEQVRGFLNACFKHFNHRVKLAAGGKHGLEMFRTATQENEPYEVVITDLGMPDMDGQRVARMIKAESPNTPVIMMTGWGSFMAAEERTALPVDAVVGKPPHIQELNDLVLRMAASAAARL